MELRLGGIGVADLGDLLALPHVLPFFHEDVAVVAVGGQVGLVVLDDDEPAEAAQSRAAVDAEAGQIQSTLSGSSPEPGGAGVGSNFRSDLSGACRCSMARFSSE